MEHAYAPVELPTPFPKTPLKKHGVTTLLPDLFETLTYNWLCGPHKHSPDLTHGVLEPIRNWSKTVQSHFNNESLIKLEKTSGDYGRFVFLHIFEFTLFHLVQLVIVEQQGLGQLAKEGILVAVAKITYASPLSCLHSQCSLL